MVALNELTLKTTTENCKPRSIGFEKQSKPLNDAALGRETHEWQTLKFILIYFVVELGKDSSHWELFNLIIQFLYKNIVKWNSF